jgi:hypothetical protein
VATVHDVIKKSDRVLPRPSAVFYAYASVDTPWVARTLSYCTPVKRGKVSSNSSTYEATQFGDSICPVCVSTVQMVVQQGTIYMGLNRHRWGTITLELQISDQATPFPSHPVFSTFPAWSLIMPTIRSSC